MKELIISAVQKAQKEELYYETVFNKECGCKCKNEFLFFIKPEITVADSGVKLDQVVSLVLENIEKFGLSIKNAKVLSAKYLADYNIIAQHYGVINKIASQGAAALSQAAKEKFNELFGMEISAAKVLGGFEFIKAYNEFTALTLEYLWQNKANKKLAGGCYVEDIKLDAETVYVLNGFHPRQLMHFTGKGRSIVVFTLCSDISWKSARGEFIGATDPTKANAGSLRRTLLENASKLGIPEVSQALNGVHLSAGPVEGLIELVRYNSDFASATGKLNPQDFAFGKMLSENFNEEQFNRILGNANLAVNGKQVSVFDLTEEMDSDDAIRTLKQYL